MNWASWGWEGQSWTTSSGWRAAGWGESGYGAWYSKGTTSNWNSSSFPAPEEDGFASKPDQVEKSPDVVMSWSSSAEQFEGLLAAMEHGYVEEERRAQGGGGEIVDFLRLLPNKDWVPFSSSELEADHGAFGFPGPDVEFYLKPSLMPVGGFHDWKAHPVYQKDLASVKKDNQHEIRLNKEIATRWTAKDLLDFSDVRGSEFDVANVITTIHRIAKAADRWYVKRDPRLQHLFAQAVNTVCDPDRRSTVRDIAKAQWSMGRLKHVDRLMQEKLAKEVVHRLDDFEPQGLSNLLWSYAYTGAPSQALLFAIVGEFWRKVAHCDPQALGNVSWALAKLAVMPDTLMLEQISSETIRKVNSFDPQGLANMVWAFATLQYENASLLSCVGDTLAQDPSRWQPQNMANLLWAYAKLLVMHEELLDAVASETTATVENWNGQGLANLSWAYAKLGSVRHHSLFETIATVVVHKIGSFSPQNTVNVAWAFAKLGLADTDLLDAIAHDVIRKSRDYSPQHCSNAAWAFGMSSILNNPMMQSLTEVAERSISEFNAQDLANLTWSCAKLLWDDAKLLQLLVSDIRRKMHTFTPQNVAIVFWSFGCLIVTDEPLTATVATDSMHHMADFGAQGLANLAHGFAKQAIKNDEVMQLIAKEAVGIIAHFTNQEFSTTVWAFAKLNVSNIQDLLEAIVFELKRRITCDLTPQDLAMLAWSFAQLDSHEGRQALEEMSWEVLRQAVDLCPQDLSNICWAYATVSFENAMMMDALAQEVVRKASRFVAQDLSNVTWAFAKLSLTEETMLDAISHEVVRKVQALLPQNLSIISWAFAKMGLLNEGMMQAIAEEALQKLHEFDGQAVGNICWSFAVLGLRHPERLFTALTNRALELLESLTAQEISNVAWGLMTLGYVELLHKFLPQALNQFLQVVTTGDGASCTDLANIAAQVSPVRGVSVKMDSYYRTNIFEPVVEKLGELQRRFHDLGPAVADYQAVLDATGAPYLGVAYTNEALSRLDIVAPRGGEGWVSRARKCCFEVFSEWRIPSSRSILTYISWSVRRQSEENRSPYLVEEGRVFQSGWSEGVATEVKELLHPFTQKVQRDMHSERVALLELLDLMLQRSARSDFHTVLASYKGTVQIYLSHFPSLSSLGVFCQFMRHCPGVWLSFSFDDAWHTCCGVPRFASGP